MKQSIEKFSRNAYLMTRNIANRCVTTDKSFIFLIFDKTKKQWKKKTEKEEADDLNIALSISYIAHHERFHDTMNISYISHHQDYNSSSCRVSRCKLNLTVIRSVIELRVLLSEFISLKSWIVSEASLQITVWIYSSTIRSKRCYRCCTDR